MIDAIAKLSALIAPSDRRWMWVVFVLTIGVAVTEAVGVASIMPFVSVATNPGLIDSTPYLRWAYETLGYQRHEDFLAALGVASVSLLVGSVVVRGLAQWAQLRFSNYQISAISTRLVDGYLHLPYAWYLNRNSSDLGAKVLTEVNNLVQGFLYPLMSGTANGLVSLALVLVLVSTDPMLAFSVSAVIGGVYGVIFLAARAPLTRAGIGRMEANTDRYRALSESLGGIKELKKSGLEAVFLQRYHEPAQRMAERGVSAALITEMPSLAMQAVIFGGMILIILYLMRAHGGLTGAVPVVAVYTLGGYRLMPSLQGLYRDLSLARYNAMIALSLYRDVTMMAELRSQDGTADEILGPLTAGLQLTDISYSYPDAARPAVRGVTFNIPARTTTGIVGLTGSGKTTLVDILLGLLPPSDGTIAFDGRPRSRATLRTWQKRVGYVSQSIYLSDDTVAANIAFGVPHAAIDQAALERAARAASIHEFIVESMADGYQTLVGERGIRLSGGQRQRLGIARALYHDPDTLILDEATSALDNLTEQAVLDAITALGGQKTIVLIAHRLSTIRHCDQIVVMHDGAVDAAGAYADVIAKSSRFRALVDAAQADLVPDTLGRQS